MILEPTKAYYFTLVGQGKVLPYNKNIARAFTKSNFIQYVHVKSQGTQTWVGAKAVSGHMFLGASMQ